MIDPNVGSCCWWWCFVLLDTTQPKSSSIHRPRIYTHNHFTTNMSHFYLTGEVGEDAFRFRSVHPSVAIPSLFPSTIKRKTKNHDMFHTNVLYFSKRNGTTSFLLYIHKLGFQRRIFYSTLWWSITQYGGGYRHGGGQIRIIDRTRIHNIRWMVHHICSRSGTIRDRGDLNWQMGWDRWTLW